MLWPKCLEALRAEIPDSLFSLWILPLEVNELINQTDSDDTLVLLAPNDFFIKHISENYLDLIKKIVNKYHNSDNPIAVSIEVNNHGQNLMALSKKTSSNKPKKKPKKASLVAVFTFAEFVVGNSNQMAHSYATEVAKKLGDKSSNPLFLYGSTGLGKSHLMHAIGHECLKQGKQVHYITSEQFVNQYVSSVRQGKIDDFKKRCREPDLFLVDDIHLLAGKKGSGTEFLSLFNDLTNQDKQIVLTSNNHPAAIKDLDDRLKSRFSWGLSVAIEPPELETRVSILVKKANSSGILLPKECAIFIAQQVVANVRELEGALNKVLATARFKDEPIDLALVQFALKEIVAIRAEIVNVNNIQKVVAEYFNIGIKDLLGKKRTRNISRPRQLAMALTRELTKKSYPEIGKAFGKRDHSTVMHAYETVQKLCENDPIFAKDYQTILALMQS